MLKNLFSKGAPPAEAESEAAAPAPAESRAITIGWLLNTEQSSIIWDTPRPVRIESQSSDPRSVGQCPSALDFDRRHYAINCPIDVHLRLDMSGGAMDVKNMLADKSPIRSDALQRWIVFQPRHEWRHPQRPVLQMLTPFVFVTDDPVYINQYPPIFHYSGDSRPGIPISGRFPIDIWPRALMWAFEWHDTSKDLILRRGEPLFYVRFEGTDPAAPIRLIEAKKTPELESFMASISGVTEFVGQTYSLFKTARERRPAKLLFPKD
ncbi:MAG: hypothetical protein E7773_11715 [Sphingomonas sp.]|uniref:hypothetical protein n=1 Tax=Sphingomonas sp. TaxID=28214 RepID=UPI00121BB412|nr:hypothetical protein [Sphingomonas sp.]THD35119.1 MAG: hypothetical protein E7773_11715 [Sphingomonas sp.]